MRRQNILFKYVKVDCNVEITNYNYHLKIDDVVSIISKVNSFESRLKRSKLFELKSTQLITPGTK